MSGDTGERLLRIRDLAKRFGPTVALDGVDLEVRAGEVHALVGENGAGKSTLMSIVAGALRPDRGAMQVDGRPSAPRAPLEARRRGVALQMWRQHARRLLQLRIEDLVSFAPHLEIGGRARHQGAREHGPEQAGQQLGADRPHAGPPSL